MRNGLALILGMLFSVCLIKGEVISWFRIQEMFLFESFHMYGVLMSAMGVGVISVFLIKKLGIKTIWGEAVIFPEKPLKTRSNLFGGIIFGLGWAMTGACPGPLYALVGYGHYVMLITIVWAVVGVYVYGLLRERLPH